MANQQGWWSCASGLPQLITGRSCTFLDATVPRAVPARAAAREPTGASVPTTSPAKYIPGLPSEEMSGSTITTNIASSIEELAWQTGHLQPSDSSNSSVEVSVKVVAGEPELDAEQLDHGGEKFSCFQASAMNTLNMFGTGPFITIPFVIASTTPAGPQALVGYAITAFACILDSMIWAELSSIWPKSGGSYIYLLYLYGEDTWGRLAAFIYIWQFLISGPMEIASGFVAMGQYFAYIDNNQSYLHHALIAAGFCVVCVLILYQGIQQAGRVTNVLWIVTTCAVFFTIVVGMTDFQSENLELPPNAFGKTPGAFVMSLGTACRFGMYDFTGYYDACQMAGEVVEPRRNIPRATVVTCVFVAGIYFLVYVSVLGYIPWDGPDGFVQLVSGDSGASCYIMSMFGEKAFGVWFARAFTVVVMITIFGANFAMMCGCAYLPNAAAAEGHFFAVLKHRHPTRAGVADYSLLLIGALSFIFCFLPIDMLVEAMMTLMLIVQFLGNSVGLLVFHYVRGKRSLVDAPWRVPLFPLPCILQIVIFSFVLITTPSYVLRGERPIIELALSLLAFGLVSFMAWSWKQSSWPWVRSVSHVPPVV